MLLEQEVPTLLRIGLFVVMVPVLGILISFCLKYKRNGYGWVLSQDITRLPRNPTGGLFS
jgi:hypothetical protein